MLRSLYSGVSGMRGFQTKLDVIGNNIANVNTVGFKASRVMFQDILSQTTSGVTAPTVGTQGGVNAKQIGLGVAIASIDTLHTPGSAMTTNVVTDLRIDGDGFFAILADPDNQQEPYLTRDGHFFIDAEKQLVTANGMFVLDEGGNTIQLQENVVQISIAKDGTIIQQLDDGTIDDTIRIGLIRVANPSGLQKIGNNLYQATLNADPNAGALTPQPANAEGLGAIISGELEMSNVDLTAEFTEMIVAQRGFQANSRIITTSDEILQEVVNLKR